MTSVIPSLHLTPLLRKWFPTSAFTWSYFRTTDGNIFFFKGKQVFLWKFFVIHKKSSCHSSTKKNLNSFSLLPNICALIPFYVYTPVLESEKDGRDNSDGWRRKVCSRIIFSLVKMLFGKCIAILGYFDICFEFWCKTLQLTRRLGTRCWCSWCSIHLQNSNLHLQGFYSFAQRIWICPKSLNPKINVLLLSWVNHLWLL